MLIYEPKGRAKEYAVLACNIYSGCDHRCTYCYSPGVVQRTREEFAQPKPRPGFLSKLARETKRRWETGLGGQVLLCFTCDPYQRIDVEMELTRKTIEVLHTGGHSVCILTKGGRRALRDIGLFTPADAFASTLTWLDDEHSFEWEPGADWPKGRIHTLHAFHEAGIPTWVSLEPVLDPMVSLQIIRETHTFVDLYKVGVLNYHPLAQTIDWRKFARDVVGLLESLNCKYYIKRDLACYLPESMVEHAVKSLAPPKPITAPYQPVLQPQLL